MTSTVVQPIAGKLGDLVGRRSVVIAGLVGFMIASVLAGLSQTMAELVVLRAAQGLFGGVLFAVPFAAVADLYASEYRVRVQGLFAAVGGLAAIIGPILGGWITDGLGWRWILYLDVPVGILGLCLVLPFLRESEHHGRWRDLDLVGSGALVAGVTPVLIGLALGGSNGWTQTSIAMLGAGILLLVGFLVLSDEPGRRWCARHSSPTASSPSRSSSLPSRESGFTVSRSFWRFCARRCSPRPRPAPAHPWCR